MKCVHCAAENESNSKYCKECGIGMTASTETQSLTTISELYGKEVEVLFFLESYTGKIAGIVNPSEDQINRYRDGILQSVTIKSGTDDPSADTVGTILTFIRQSKEHLGEKFNENQYRNFSPSDLKKEYLKLFEKLLMYKDKRQQLKSPVDIKTEKK
jgi:hypothetical protein